MVEVIIIHNSIAGNARVVINTGTNTLISTGNYAMIAAGAGAVTNAGAAAINTSSAGTVKATGALPLTVDGAFSDQMPVPTTGFCVSLLTCIKISTINFLFGVAVGIVLKKKVRGCAATLIKKIMGDK